MVLRNKAIVLISPQPWSEVYISKHHYAIELAKRGNEVYFFNPVSDSSAATIEIKPHDEISRLYLVSFACLIPYWTKFHIRWLFNLFLHFQTRRALQKIRKKIDIVWDFDCNNTYQNLDIFKAKLKVFHPVDQSTLQLPLKKKPDIIFSVSNDILNHYSDCPVPKHFVNHGLGGAFLEMAQNKQAEKCDNIPERPLQAAYIGNLMVPFIGHKVILNTIRTFPDIQFHFFGSYEDNGNYYPNKVLQFIRALQSFPNVKLHGRRTQAFIVNSIKDIDLFFYYYCSGLGYNRDNTHKILEYLSTGKAVIGNTLSAYRKNGLFIQVENEMEWAERFQEVVQNICSYNSVEQQRKRVAFVLENSYENHIRVIENLINKYCL